MSRRERRMRRNRRVVQEGKQLKGGGRGRESG